MAELSEIERHLFVTLKDHFDIRFQDSQRAIDKAEATITNRLSSMDLAQFVRKEELRDMTQRLEMRTQRLERSAAVAEGKASQGSVLFTGALAAVSILISVANLLITLFGRP